MDKAPKKPLGRQATKTAHTRDKIIQAVISLIVEGGFNAASSTRIARQAGVTWGAVQHHFGDKEAILQAILERSHEQFQQRMENLALDGLGLEQRVSLFIDEAWQHYQDSTYLAALEILMATRGERDAHSAHALYQHWAGTHLGLWRRLFGELGLGDDALQDVIMSVHFMLTGLIVGMMFQPGAVSVRHHLEHTKQFTLLLLKNAAH